MQQLQKNKRLLSILCSALLLAWVLLYNFYINKSFFVSYFLDADGAAEIQLARTMYENGEGILSTGWYYSTELRFLHNQLFMRPLFGLFNSSIGTHLAATFLISAFMALCALLFFYSLKLSFPQAALAAGLVITPFSREIFYINFANCYYSMFTAFLFLFLALSNFQFYSEKPLIKRILLVLLGILSLLLGMCGIRFAIILFLPALIVCAFTEFLPIKEFSGARATAIKLRGTGTWLLYTLGFGIGYLVYEKVLLAKYTVADLPGRLTLSSVEEFISKLRQVPAIMLRLFRELLPAPVLSGFGVLQLFLLCLFFAMLACGVYVWRKRASYSARQRFYINFSWATLIASILAMALTSDYHMGGDYAATRYLLPGVLPLATLPVLLLHNTQMPDRRRFACLASVVALLVLNPIALTIQCKNYPQYSYAAGYGTPQLQAEIQALQAQGFESGYATFRYAGLTNVLTSNQLQTVGVYASPDGLRYRTWLEPKNPERIGQSAAPQFLILSANEYGECQELLAGLPVLSQNEFFAVVQIDSIDALLQK